MEGRQFDAVVKLTGHGLSRRRLLAALLGGAGASTGRGLNSGQAAEGISYAECEQQGGQVVARYSRCHAYRESGGARCGAFEYHWENLCALDVRISMALKTIDAGCAPCLF